MNVLRNWNLFRGIRLVLGLVIVVQSWMANDWFLAIVGCIFSGMALFNVGCCITSACSSNYPLSQQKSEAFIEEIK